MDISLYTNPHLYQRIQLSRPDYKGTIIAINNFSLKHQEFSSILDLCGGNGYFSSLIATNTSVKKVTLLDINKGLLDQAHKLSWGASIVSPIQADVLDYALPENHFNLVLSIFAYHHIADAQKLTYIQNAYNTLKPSGLMLVGEIYSPNKQSTLNYYEALLKEIPEEYQTKELRQFLMETAQSDNFEFKVPKKYADEQFAKIGFTLIEEKKIWAPSNIDQNIGTFLQIYQRSSSI